MTQSGSLLTTRLASCDLLAHGSPSTPSPASSEVSDGNSSCTSSSSRSFPAPAHSAPRVGGPSPGRRPLCAASLVRRHAIVVTCCIDENQVDDVTPLPATSRSTSPTCTPERSAGEPFSTPTTRGLRPGGAWTCMPKGSASTVQRTSSKPTPGAASSSSARSGDATTTPGAVCCSLAAKNGFPACTGTFVSKVSVNGSLADWYSSNQFDASTGRSPTARSTKPRSTPAASAGKPGKTSTTRGTLFT
mmetsp:Transcript_65490/g.176227  ORF Transcript_65490/g.176227 Transcript_65490/m.176227 type:complete len:246 (+) Transcript_65490:171-908(+)